MTKRDGDISGKTAHFDRTGNVPRRSPSHVEHHDCELSPSKQNQQRYSLGNYNDGSFNDYRDSRSAPNSTPGSAAGSQANSRSGSRPGSRLQSRCNSQESIIDLFDSMTLKYGQQLDGTGPLEFKTPKPKRLANTKMSYTDRVRINSAVWRSWHIQYVKKQKSAVCQFSSPLPETRLQSDVIQGKTALTGYKPEELGVVVRNYNKWRTFSKDILRHRPLTSVPDLEDNAIDLDSPHPPLSPGTGGYKLVNDDLFKDFADTLFISRKKKLFTAPAPKKVTHLLNYNPDYLQPDLSTLLPEVDDEFMEAITSVQAILSKTPTKNDPRQMGLMDDVPSTYFTSENFRSLLNDYDMEPQIVTAADHGVTSHFSVDQSPPPLLKSVSFSAPTTPHQSTSPGFSMPYDIRESLQAYVSPGVPHSKSTQHMQQHHDPYNTTVFPQNEGHQSMNVPNQVMQHHPTIMETLQNAPSLPTSPQNTISTVNVTAMSKERCSPAASTPSTSGHVTPEAKMEPGSPPSRGCMSGTVMFTPATTSALFDYQLGDSPNNLMSQDWTTAKPNEKQWNPATSTTMSSNQFENQFLSLVGDMGGHTLTLQGNHITTQSPLYPGHHMPQAEEMMDYIQFQPLPPQQDVFKLPNSGDLSVGSGVKSPKGNKRSSSGQILVANVQEAFNRKKSTGGHEQTMLREDQERHTMSIPSSCHASNASSAASSPGNEEGAGLEDTYHNSKKKSRTDATDKDDRAVRRRRKHLDSEHKRRYNIQNGLDELQRIVPAMNLGNPKDQSSKISTALLLQKAQEHILSLQEEMQVLADEETKTKQDINNLNDEIEQCQDALPDTGAPVNSQNDAQLNQMLEEYIEEEMAKDWKFWIFSKFARPLFSPFLNAVKLSTGSSISGDVTNWMEDSCRLRHLRSLALLPVRQISKETSILTDPSKLPEQVQDIISREMIARKRTPPPDV